LQNIQQNSADAAAEYNDPNPDPVIIALNTEIIKALNIELTANGGQLILADASEFFKVRFRDAAEGLPAYTEQLSSAIGAHYVDVSSDLIAASAQASILWNCDPHWNSWGNQIFAGSLFNWFKDHV
jgi:hypothetical protein